MSLRLEMLQVARLAPKLLGDSSERVRRFLLGQINSDGGFKDRAGASDLYYTVFALDGLAALQAAAPTECVAAFLAAFGDGHGLDFAHLCCLARCWAAIASPGLSPTDARRTRAGPALRAPSPDSPLPAALLRRLERHRARDGGYHPFPGSDCGTAYGAFLALGAYQDLKVALPEPSRLAQSLETLRTGDGAWTNEAIWPSGLGRRSLPDGSTNATAAAVTVLRNLGVVVNSAVGDWLLARAHPPGGFLAMPSAPMPDLLSTAAALHALSGLQVSFAHLTETCLDFVDSLWDNAGGFHGNWSDDQLDCEYTFYGLLALGHLSL